MVLGEDFTGVIKVHEGHGLHIARTVCAEQIPRGREQEFRT